MLIKSRGLQNMHIYLLVSPLLLALVLSSLHGSWWRKECDRDDLTEEVSASCLHRLWEPVDMVGQVFDLMQGKVDS